MGGSRILYINPTSFSAPNVHQELTDYLNAARCAQTACVDVVGLECAPTHLEHSFYETLVGTEVLRLVKKAELDGYAAAIIGCFYDPFIDAAKEILDHMVVTAPAESCLRLAASLGNRTAVMVGRKKWVPHMDANAAKYGMKEQITFHCLDIGVDDFQANPSYTHQRLHEEIKKALEEDRAEVIILGCTMEYGFYRELQAEFPVPILDASLAPLKFAEFLVEVQKTCGWHCSKAGGWSGPKTGEMATWGILEKYGLTSLF